MIHSHDLYNRADDAVIKILAELMIHSHYGLYNRADDAVIMICITELMMQSL